MTINHEALKKRRAGGGGSKFGWKAKENGNKVFILPPHSKFIGAWEQMTDLAISFRIHYFKFEGGRETERSRCLAELKQRCPACEVYRAYNKSSDLGLAEMAKSVRASDQYLFNILDMNNLQQGIQPWPANYTCWDKVMEIAANPAWGNVVDPENGVEFEVTMTPGSRTRSGHNAYSVTPSPQRKNVQGVLDAIEGWRDKLDALDLQVMEAKTAEEMTEYLEAMGFPPTGGKPAVGAVKPPTPSGTPVPAGGAGPIAVSIPGAVSVPTPAPAPIPAVPTVPQPTPVPVAPVPVSMPQTPAVTSAPPQATVEKQAPLAVHYDPGAGYEEKVSAAERPANAPRCFGDYNSSVHRCTPCPVVVDCQLRLLNS